MKHMSTVSRHKTKIMATDTPMIAASVLLKGAQLGVAQQAADLIITVAEAIKGS